MHFFFNTIVYILILFVFFDRRLEKQRVELAKSKNQLAVDLERLLNQKEVDKLIINENKYIMIS